MNPTSGNVGSDRRDFLAGVGGLAASLLFNSLGRGMPPDGEIPPNPTVKAKRAVQITLVGGLSHVDSFDYKPVLARLHGKTLKTDDAPPDLFFNQMGLLRKNDWEFQQRGQSGLWISNLFPNIARMADELTVIRSMVTETANHTPALFFENSGFAFNGFPSLGSWLSFGLEPRTNDIPTFVVLPDSRSEANGGASNWTSGFLPAEHQGVTFRASAVPVRDLFPSRSIPAGAEADAREFLAAANREHLLRLGNEPSLAARIRSVELAGRMQKSVPIVADIDREPVAIREKYGIHRQETADCGRRCLLARRLLEHGTRFVQVYAGGAIAGAPRQSWDAHENVVENHSAEAARVDQPVAALLEDLRGRGMLEDTLVLFTTEFGRTPFTQSPADSVGAGRDHNKYGFSCWLAGAGLKHGIAHGATDDVGWKAVENPVSWHDFHATVLSLMGIDHTRLTYYHNGIRRRLTNVHGEVIHAILA